MYRCSVRRKARRAALRPDSQPLGAGIPAHAYPYARPCLPVRPPMPGHTPACGRAKLPPNLHVHCRIGSPSCQIRTPPPKPPPRL